MPTPFVRAGPVGDTGTVRVTARTEYALRAVLALAAGPAGQDDRVARVPTPLDRLAEAQDLPRKFLEAILADLRRAGIVESRRGVAGGYLLARHAEAITVGDVIRAVDGPLAEVRGLRPQDTAYEGDARHLATLWVAVRSALREVLDGITVAQLRDGDLPTSVRELASRPDAWVNR